MTLYRRILLGIFVISFCLIGLAFLSTQLILMDGYRQLEEADATQNIERVRNVLQNNIDSIKVDEIEWLERPPPPPRYVPPYPEQRISDDDLFNRMSLAAKLNISLLLDRQNNIVFHNAIDMETGENSSIPQLVLASVKPGSPLLNGINPQTTIKGILTVPQGLLMIISVPVFPRGRHDASWGRFIAGRYIDNDEIQHIADSTNLDVKVVPYHDDHIPSDFQLAKNNLDNDNSFYVEPGNSQFVSSYTLMNDVYGKPALILRAQMPRFIYQRGQESINSFFVSLIIIVVFMASGMFLFLERTILSRLMTLNTGLAQMKLSNNFTLEVPTVGHDEITNLTSGIKQLLKEYAQTKHQLQDTQNNFEKQVVARTTELSSANTRLEQELDEQKQAQQLLSQARDKAVADLQLKSQLLANVSHDARTPLTIIGLNTEMLQQGRHGELNSKQNEVLDRILNATRQLLSFVTNMLNEAQLKHGKMSFVNVTFEPKLLIEEFVSMLEPLAEAKGIKLKTELDLALPNQIKGDPERLKQILTNLTENAIKFTDEGSVTIKALRTDSQHWVIQVIDTGRGIPIEVQNRIFEAYWQLNSANSNSTLKHDSNRGVGLGLSIVRQIIQLMNGSITVESKLGQGTTFTVTLPINKEQEKVSSESIPQING